MTPFRPDEFKEYVNDSAGRLLAVIRRILRNDADAEDALQETYLAAWRARDHFDGRSTMSTWMHRIAVNTALNKFRSIAAATSSIDADSDQIERAADSKPNDDLALREVVWGAIDLLPDDQRVVLVLRDVEQLTSDEVAERLNLSPAAVRQRLHRARKHVAETLTPELCGAEGMTCGGRLDLLLDMIDNALADEFREPVLSHVAACTTCQTYASGYKQSILAPSNTAEQSAPVPRGLVERIIQVVRMES